MDTNMDTIMDNNKFTQTPSIVTEKQKQKKKKKKKKKKKVSYNDMMAQILKPTITDEERIQLKKNSLEQNALGGGRFSKMEKI
jgi:hypothetical protein